MGSHLVKHWSRAQHTIALSSGEAELYAATKGGSEGLGIVNLLMDMGETRKQLELNIDASATKGAITRKGAGRMKHVETQYLWIQQATADGRIRCRKIPRETNVADMMTHHWNRKDGEKHLQGMSLILKSGSDAQ